MDIGLLEKFLTVSGPWGIVGILIWLLIAEVRHNMDLRAEMRITVDAVRTTATSQVAAFERMSTQLTSHDQRCQEIQQSVKLLVDRPKTRTG